MRSTQTIFKITIISIFLVYSFSFTTIAQNNNPIYYVGGYGPGNYTSIQSAINDAPSNTHIYLYNGTYNETLTINKPLLLTGENPQTTVLHGQQKDSVIRLNSDYITITNLTIHHGRNQFPEASIAIYSNHNTVTNTILNNSYYGIVLIHASYNKIHNNHIHDNHQCGIYFSKAKNNQLTHNIVDTQPFNGFGIYDFSDNNLIANNTFLNNQLYGVNIRDSYNNKIIDNTMINNSYGLHIPQPQFQTIFENNTYKNNELSLIEASSYTYIVLPETVVLILIGLYFSKKLFFNT